MKVRGILAVVLLVSIISCQKEIDWGLGTNSSTTNKLLIKIVSKTGTDSTIIDYSYSSSKLLIEEKTTGSSGTTVLDNDLKIYRAASGLITRTVQVAAGLVAAGIDSVVTRYNYDVTSSRYTSAVFNISISGTAVTDSTVFTYDASGKIIKDDHYQKVAPLPIAIKNLSNQYTYSSDGLNLTSLQVSASSTPGGPLAPIATQTFTYDNKKAPLIMKTDAVLLLRTPLYSAQNQLTAAMVNTIDPAADFNLALSYRYNSSNKPDSSFSTRTPGGGVTISKYFYQ